MSFFSAKPTAPLTGAVAGLTGILQGASVGVREFEVAAGPNGDNQAVAIAFGDMTSIPAAAYVVPHFNGLVSYGGVGAAVARRGALVGMQAYERLLGIEAKKYHGIRGFQHWGDVFVTDSNGGLSTHLLNAVSIGSGPFQVEIDTISRTTVNALALAAQMGMKSVVFPALGTGVLGILSDQASAFAILGAIETFRAANPSVVTPSMVTIAIHGDAGAYKNWVEMLKAGPRTEAAKAKALSSGARRLDVDKLAKGLGSMVATVNWVKREPHDPTVN